MCAQCKPYNRRKKKAGRGYFLPYDFVCVTFVILKQCISMCVCRCAYAHSCADACVCVCVCMYICLCMNVKAKSQPEVPQQSPTFHFGGLVSHWRASELQRSTYFHLLKARNTSTWQCTWLFHMCSGDLTLCPHVHKARTLPTKLSLDPKLDSAAVMGHRHHQQAG